jgi:hypothetical protein
MRDLKQESLDIVYSMKRYYYFCVDKLETEFCKRTGKQPKDFGLKYVGIPTNGWRITGIVDLQFELVPIDYDYPTLDRI